MFNDKYGLTKAVLNGDKIMTRRKAPIDVISKCQYFLGFNFDQNIINRCDPKIKSSIIYFSRYKIDDKIALAQKYDDIIKELDKKDTLTENEKALYERLKLNAKENIAGNKNKMFVRADLMPHHIKITDIDVQQLQDISDEDILKEGIYYVAESNLGEGWTFKGSKMVYDIPIDAFEELIDKTCGKGTWDSNPLVWVYSFKLYE